MGLPWLPVVAQYLQRQRAEEAGGANAEVPPLASPTLEQLCAAGAARSYGRGAWMSSSFPPSSVPCRWRV